MLSRRQLLKRSGLASAALLTGANAWSEAPSSMSPHIRKLTSRRHEALPISPTERLARQQRARELMASEQLDAILLAEGTSLNYFTGVRWWGSERLTLAVMPARGQPFFVCPAFEEGRAREQISQGTGSAPVDVHTWEEDANPYEVLVNALRDRELSAGHLGLEESMRFVFSDSLRKALPKAAFSSATPITAGCRAIKSPHEIALMRLASEVTHAAYEATYRSLRTGMTSQEISALTALAHQRLGFVGEADLVLIGAYSAFPHGSLTPSRLDKGDIVLMDGGCDVEGYKSDITRTVVLGTPTSRMRSIFETVKRAQEAALATAGPGIACGDVDAAARRVISEAGFGADYARFTHRLGHGIGMDGHEWPYLVRGNRSLLQPGVTTSNEPGIYLPGEFGIRLEDDMVITDTGAELLTPRSQSLDDPFART